MATEMHSRIHEGVYSVLSDLVFDPPLAGGVVKDTDLDDANMETPCVVASIEGEQEELLGGTTLKKHRRYAVRVFFVATDFDFPENEGILLRWREMAMEAFQERARDRTTGLILPGCAEVYDTIVTPKVVIDERLQQYQHVVSGFVVKAAAYLDRNR